MHSTEVLQQPVRSHNPAHLQPGEEEEDGESLGTCSGSPFFACAGLIVFSGQQLWYFQTLRLTAVSLELFYSKEGTQ